MAVVFSQNWDVEIGGTDFANAARVTSPTYAGAGALRLVGTASVAYWENTAPGGAQNVWVARFRVRWADLPDIDTMVAYVAATSNYFGVTFDAATGKLGCSIDNVHTDGVGGPVLALDTWYDVEVVADLTTSTPTVNATVDGSALPQADWSTAQTYTTYKLGPNDHDPTMTVYYDELECSHTASDYPLSALVETQSYYATRRRTVGARR